jgi:hypothetical protein
MARSALGHLRRFLPVQAKSALRPITRTFSDVRKVPILLQKSICCGRRAKLRNVRIGKDWFLNQSCVWVLDFESMLLPPMSKILLQQYLPSADIDGYSFPTKRRPRWQRIASNVVLTAKEGRAFGAGGTIRLTDR